jgi:hypothetical protein
VEDTTMLRAVLRNSGMQDNYSLTRIPEACGTGCALPCLLCLVISGTSTVSCGHKSESGQDVPSSDLHCGGDIVPSSSGS